MFDKAFLKRLGTILRDARKELEPKLSGKELGQRESVSLGAPTISKIENGSYPGLDVTQLGSICDELGVSLAAVLLEAQYPNGVPGKELLAVCQLVKID